jgi:hypothetical protein
MQQCRPTNLPGVALQISKQHYVTRHSLYWHDQERIQRQAAALFASFNASQQFADLGRPIPTNEQAQRQSVIGTRLGRVGGAMVCIPQLIESLNGRVVVIDILNITLERIGGTHKDITQARIVTASRWSVVDTHTIIIIIITSITTIYLHLASLRSIPSNMIKCKLTIISRLAKMARISDMLIKLGLSGVAACASISAGFWNYSTKHRHHSYGSARCLNLTGWLAVHTLYSSTLSESQ